MNLLSGHTCFLGCDTDFAEASVVIYGAPYDGTSSFRPGSRFAPAAIRNASDGLETYSPYQQKDLEDYAFHDAGDLETPFGDSVVALNMVQEQTEHILAAGKKPFMIGGEHLLSLGAVRACLAQYPDLHVIHFDAHTDLRDDYLGDELSHATVLKQIWELLGDDRIYSFGVRSGLREEFKFGREHLEFHPFQLTNVKWRLKENGLVEKQTPIYVTIDLDVLDPSIFPGTGTPEPGGVSFRDLLIALINMRGLNVVGMDVVELAPDYDPSGVSTLVAWKVIRESLLTLMD